VGENFRFGRRAEGDLKTLKRLTKVYNYKLKSFPCLKINRQPISSTYIRQLIKGGDLIKAQKLLDRPVSVLGTVIKGDSLARRLGFPTANINPHHEVLPPSGVYAVKINFNNKKLIGLCNIGTKPTFKIKGEKHIEAHVFNFKQSIYGKYLEIAFIKKIREEKKFIFPQELIAQIKKDVIFARRFFACH
jgi:riboflavin kinase/FMN adenylyltransferase